MSLLMEALRKAEEAKSKASHEKKESHSAAREQAPVDISPHPETSDFPEVEPTPAEPDQGPAVINPDPDEEEILAAHSTDSGLELVEKEPEADFANNDLEDDGLSLLQSSYFSRTQNTGSSLDDEDLEQDFEPYDDSDTSADAPEFESENGPADLFRSTNEEPPQEALPDTHPEDTPVQVLAETQSAANRDSEGNKDAEARKTQEKARRESAGALFLAKEDSRKRRLKKLLPLAAIVLVLPLAGIVYWLFTSLGSGSDMQFNVPANGNLANRNLSDPVTPLEASGTDLAAQTAAGESLQNEAADAESESTATALMAVADNPGGAATTTEIQSETGTIAPEPEITVPLPRQTTDVAANAPTPSPPVQNAPQPQTAAVADTPATVTAATTAANQASQAPAQQTGLSFTRTTTELVINPDLNAAYDSYQQGDYATAGRLYQQVLVSEPNNKDAMLHLASVYLKQNNPAMARSLYVRLLELNPRDPLARAGILETVQGDPVQQEAELKSLISAYPDTAQLSFALGNLYATQNRWNEAQSAYFEALLTAKSSNTGPVSPDYAFNLAVSLERINQSRSALDFYREAEVLSRSSTPGFAPALLLQRLNSLELRLR